MNDKFNGATVIGAEDATTGELLYVKSTNQAQHVTGLAVNAVIQGAGTYNTTDVLGYRVLAQGSASWSVTPKNGTAQTIPQAAMIVGDVYPEHLSAITVGTGGSVLLYTPA